MPAKIIKFPSIEKFSKKEKIIALGKFYSIHIGHKKILKTASDIAKKKELEFGTMIFSQRKIDNFYSLEERMEFINEFNPDFFLIFNPTKKNFSISYKEFENYLEKINVKEIVVGKDFKYGHNQEGDVSTLKKKFNVTIIKEIKNQKEKISSKKIFEELCKDNLDYYLKSLGHYFFYKGKVIHGKGIGTELDMPTANVEYPAYKININDGIYYSYVTYKNNKFPSLTSISTNPTISNDNKRTYESFIYNFDKTIYDEEIKVELIEKYRDPIKFDSIEELKNKLSQDKELGKTYFNLP
ncbi:MAG: riboflavin biosynthesis protein [Candidatus Tyloplasma litorale]|nr:MAG: riboflavin biosynthesis protein [Mycoplasmatales bacterium]